MKNFIFTLLFVVVYSSAEAQYKLSFEKTAILGNTFRVTLHMKGEHSFGLGSNNLRFSYPVNALANPRIVAEKFPSKSYKETTLEGTNQAKGIISINTIFTGKPKSSKLLVTEKGVDLVTLEFDVLDATQINQLTWRITGAQPRTAVVADDKLTKLNAVEIRNNNEIAEDGKMKSNIFNAVTLEITNAMPNPVQNNLSIAFTATHSGNVAIKVIDILGSVVETQDFAAEKGYNKVSLDMSHLTAGTYVLSIKDDLQEAVERIVKQ